MDRKKFLILGLAALLMIAIGILASRSTLVKKTVTAARAPKVSVSLSQNLPYPDFEALADRVEDAVVSIQTERSVPVRYSDLSGDLFKGFGGFDLLAGSSSSKWIRMGSGFIVDPNGYVLTNSHIVETASGIQVKLHDQRIMAAVLVGMDPPTDLAVLKIRGVHLPSLHLADSGVVPAGEWAAAFGGPFGLEGTIISGIIGGKGQYFGPDYSTGLLQTDAIINAGNSGGPLVNLQGEVIGINLNIEDRSHTYSGMSFAIPAPAASRAYKQILKRGKISRGWIGVSIQDVTPQIAQSFHLIGRRGVLVSDVAPDSPASQAGVAPGDIILEFGGHPVDTSNSLAEAVAGTELGRSVQVTVLRGGKIMSLDVVIEERPSSVARFFPFTQGSEPGTLGITVENISPEIQTEMGLSSRNGVLVVDVAPGSAADVGGLQPGDVILGVNHSPIYAAEDLLAAMHGLSEGSTVLLRLEREHRLFYAAFDLD